MSKINFTLTPIKNDKKKIAKVLIQGNIVLKELEQLHNDLKNAAMNYDELEILMKNIEAIDLPAIQLLFSMKKTFQQDNKTLRVTLDFSEDIRELLKNTGFENLEEFLQTTTDETTIWALKTHHLSQTCLKAL